MTKSNQSQSPTIPATTISDDSNNETVKTIAAINDHFRKTFDRNFGRVVYTLGVDALSSADKAQLMHLVQTFSDFNTDNDPYGEHDFLSIEFQGEKYFAKIDYYDYSFELGSEYPEDPNKTQRVLTIMLAYEY